jgi:hypothetical protein
MDETPTNISILSSFAEEGIGRLELRCSGALEEGLKRALESSNDEPPEPPAHKKQKKESWAFHEPAKVVKAPPLSFESAISNMHVSTLAGLAGDIRRARIAQMVQQAAEMATAIGKLDPEPESLPNGRRRFQRRNSFVIHPNRSNTGMFPGCIPPRPKNVTHNEENGALGLPPHEANLFFRRERRMSLPLSQSLSGESMHSTRSDSSAD